MFKIIHVLIFVNLLVSVFACSSTKSTDYNGNNLYGLTQEQYDFVKKETVPNGKLDFEKQFKANGLTLLDNVAYNQKAASLYTWAFEIKKLGVNDVNDAVKLYESILDVELRESQKNAMKNAYVK